MWFILLIVAVVSAYYYMASKYQYWKKRNVPHPIPSMIFGNVFKSLTLQKSIGEMYSDIYREYPDCSYVGFYKGLLPGLVIRDPQLIRDVLNQEYKSFHDNDMFSDDKHDVLTSYNTFFQKGEKWRIYKQHITPCFTAKKMKQMCPFIQEAANKMVTYLEKEIGKNDSNGFEMHDLFKKYSFETLASCVFGLEGKSFDEPNPIFKQMGSKLFNSSLFTTMKLYTMLLLPSVSKFLKIVFIPKDVTEYLCNIISETLKYREKNNFLRFDFLNLITETKEKHGLSDIEVVAHTVGFFTDGFEASSSAMTYTLYQLAANPEICEKLRREINDALLKHNNSLDYDSINNLEYLDMVINETLRLHPSNMMLLRVCTKPFTFPPPTGVGKNVEVEVGTPVVASLHGLQTDPKYFKNPNVFDPDRFLPENRQLIVRGSYLPFSDGPRNCHGQRFALMQTKVALVNIISNFDVTVNEKTKIPLQFDPRCVFTHVDGGMWLNFSKRK